MSEVTFKDGYSKVELVLRLRIHDSQAISKSDLFEYLKYRLNLNFGSHGLIKLDEVFVLDGKLKS